MAVLLNFRYETERGRDIKNRNWKDEEEGKINKKKRKKKAKDS